MPNIENLKKYKNIHMLGIGGVSMSGIAEILHNWGFNITGTDATQSEITDSLNKKRIKVTIGHDFKNLSKADIIIYSAAISQTDPEIIEAKKLNIPLIERSTFLGEITKCYKDTITISGTHGKTTTTSMVSLAFLEAKTDPSIQVGAILKQIDGNNKIGNSEYFIIEACEYVESFLKFCPKSTIILNIDNDHLDYFKTFDNIKNSFKKFAKLLPSNGFIVLNADDKNCLELKNYSKAIAITYGITNKNCNFYADNITFNELGFATFDVYHNNNFYNTFELSVPGIHNVSNALACIALCDSYNINKKHIKSALKLFTGANRRFEFKGTINNAQIYDDYAHHPTEIQATANILKTKKYNKSWVIFQPHTYSRTYSLLEDFAQILLNFDNIILLDIYAAREQNIYNITTQDLVEKINELGKKSIYLPNFEECTNYIKKHVQPNDIVITLGAGTVTQIGPMILNQK